MSLKTDYKDDILAVGNLRKYQMIQNNDGTVSFQDVTQYEQTGDVFGAGDINRTNQAVNEKFDSGDVVDPMLTTEPGFAADAYQTKLQFDEQNKKLNNNYNEGHIVALENTTQPYTVPEDGLLFVILTCSTTRWSYASIDINGVRRAQVQNTGNSSVATSFSFEVYKGDVLTWNDGDGGSVTGRIHTKQ